MNLDITNQQLALLVAVVLWEFLWKGFALWRAAKLNQSVWFVLIMIINTVGILPIMYLIFTQTNEKASVNKPPVIDSDSEYMH